MNWDTKHWRDFLKLLGLYLAEDYTENLLQLHDAEIVRLRNYYEVHKELFEGVQKWEESWRLFLEFEVLPYFLSVFLRVQCSVKKASSAWSQSLFPLLFTRFYHYICNLLLIHLYLSSLETCKRKTPN